KSSLLGAACIGSVTVLLAYKYGSRLRQTGPIGDVLTHLRGFVAIGLSYLVFKAIDYCVAIRSNPRPVLTRLQDGLYGLSFLIFFPAFVSGPIQRYSAYVKDQLQPWQPMTITRLRADLIRISIGV